MYYHRELMWYHRHDDELMCVWCHRHDEEELICYRDGEWMCHHHDDELMYDVEELMCCHEEWMCYHGDDEYYHLDDWMSCDNGDDVMIYP
jgi:hypothetical protein